MGKTLIIYDNGRSDWESVQVIKSNLVESYRSEETNEIVEVYLSPDCTDIEVWNAYVAIKANQPDRIIFIDGVPHPNMVLSFFNDNDFITKPELIFHVYGDFTIRTRDWSQCESILKKYKILFLCASDKQVSLIKKFVINSDNIVKKCPFSVDSKSYYNSSELRVETRKKLNVADDEIVLIYTGRLSYQKNIHHLLNFFKQIKAFLKVKVKLYIVGEFDDMGAPFVGKNLLHANYYHEIMNIYDFMSPEIRKSIIFTGKLNTTQLNQMYNASDLFISCSVHNDEDFGMSPIEALATGTPALLTDWGGYSSFASEYCKLFETEILADKIKLKFSSALKQSISLLNKKPDREKVSKYYSKLFSIEAISSLLKESLQTQDFEGFSEDFYLLDKAFTKYPKSPLSLNTKNAENFYSDLYKRLYSSYES